MIAEDTPKPNTYADLLVWGADDNEVVAGRVPIQGLSLK